MATPPGQDQGQGVTRKATDVALVHLGGVGAWRAGVRFGIHGVPLLDWDSTIIQCAARDINPQRRACALREKDFGSAWIGVGNLPSAGKNESTGMNAIIVSRPASGYAECTRPTAVVPRRLCKQTRRQVTSRKSPTAPHTLPGSSCYFLFASAS